MSGLGAPAGLLFTPSTYATRRARDAASAASVSSCVPTRSVNDREPPTAREQPYARPPLSRVSLSATSLVSLATGMSARCRPARVSA